MDIYLAFEISHVISPVCDHEGQKCEGDTGGREREANSLLRAKIWEIHRRLSGKPRRIFPDLEFDQRRCFCCVSPPGDIQVLDDFQETAGLVSNPVRGFY